MQYISVIVIGNPTKLRNRHLSAILVSSLNVS